MFLDAALFMPLGVLTFLLFSFLLCLCWNQKPIKPQRKIEKENEESSIQSSIASNSLEHITTFDIGFNKLSLHLKSNGNQVLNNVSGVIKHGRTTAVMGPSGSGKTTFLTTLSGRANYGEMTGEIYLNGEIDSLKKYPKLVGFVPQEDIMHRDLTVKENLEFSAKTRLPRRMKAKQRRQIVENAIMLLGLNEIRDSLIGDEDARGISGGQRKRVNIGIELVANPSVLFLDEPTSGLDSTSSKSICAALKHLALSSGINVVAVIHSPRYEIFQMFDDVLLLGKGGRTVYLGPTSQSLSYFEDLGFICPPRVNAADFLLDVVAGEVPNERNVTPAELSSRWSSRPLTSENDEALIRMKVSNDDDEIPDKFSVVSNGAKKLQFWKKSNLEDGSWWLAAGMFIISFLLPPLSFVSLFFRPTRRSITCGLIGACVSCGSLCWLAFWGMIETGYSPGNLFFALGFFVWLHFWFLCWTLYLVWNFGRDDDPRYPGYFLASSILPLFLVIFQSYYRKTDPPKYKQAAFIGTGCTLIGCFAIALQLMIPSRYAIIEPPIWLYGIILLGILTGITQLIVGFHRYQRLPTFDRITTNIFVKVYLVCKRSFVQQSRFYVGFLFDITLPVATSLFLGVIYYRWDYTKPIIDSIPFISKFDCEKFIDSYLCVMLNLPINDPYPSLANISALSMALCAITSSLRVFGKEKVIFQRESLAQLSTESYFIGKCLGHMPTVILAPLGFALTLYGFTRPEAPFWKYFVIYFAVYFVCSGLAYLVSIVIPANLAHIVGVLCILIFMMFSGASPSLGQLQTNPLLGDLLYYPTFLSLFRWTNEVFYLMNVVDKDITQKSLNIYGYYWDDVPLAVLMISIHAVLFRLLAYIALVKREE